MSRGILKVSAFFLFGVLLFVAGSLYASALYEERQQQQQAAGNLDGAIGAASAAARFDPFDAAPLQAQSSIFYGRGRNAESKRFMEQAEERSPNSYTVWLSLGNIEMAMGEFQNAQESYAEAETLNPLDGTATGGLGQALLRQDKLEEAGEAYGRLEEIGDLDATGYYDLGRIRVRVGDAAEGEKDIRRAIRQSEETRESMEGEMLDAQNQQIESMKLALADALVVQRRYDQAYQIVAENRSEQAPALLQLIGTDPEGYRDSVLSSDIY